jgi:hypothetical protein
MLCCQFFFCIHGSKAAPALLAACVSDRRKPHLLQHVFVVLYDYSISYGLRSTFIGVTPCFS